MQKSMNEDDRIEGSGGSKMVQVIRKFGGAKNDINIEFATVTAPPPELKIKVDNMSIELEKDDLMVAEYLTKHKRTITVRKHPKPDPKIGPSKMRFKSGSVNESMTPAGTGPHTHDITMIEMSDVHNDFNFDHMEIEFEDLLKKGDRVIVANIDNGQTYVILDRAVSYE